MHASPTQSKPCEQSAQPQSSTPTCCDRARTRARVQDRGRVPGAVQLALQLRQAEEARHARPDHRRPAERRREARLDRRVQRVVGGVADDRCNGKPPTAPTHTNVARARWRGQPRDRGRYVHRAGGAGGASERTCAARSHGGPGAGLRVGARARPRGRAGVAACARARNVGADRARRPRRVARARNRDRRAGDRYDRQSERASETQPKRQPTCNCDQRPPIPHPWPDGTASPHARRGRTLARVLDRLPRAGDRAAAVRRAGRHVVARVARADDQRGRVASDARRPARGPVVRDRRTRDLCPRRIACTHANTHARRQAPKPFRATHGGRARRRCAPQSTYGCTRS